MNITIIISLITAGIAVLGFILSVYVVVLDKGRISVCCEIWQNNGHRPIFVLRIINVGRRPVIIKDIEAEYTNNEIYPITFPIGDGDQFWQLNEMESLEEEFEGKHLIDDTGEARASRIFLTTLSGKKVNVSDSKHKLELFWKRINDWNSSLMKGA